MSGTGLSSLFDVIFRIMDNALLYYRDYTIIYSLHNYLRPADELSHKSPEMFWIISNQSKNLLHNLPVFQVGVS